MTKNDLEQLIKMHGNAIYQFCFHLTGCRDDADDLYQETLCKAYEIRKRIRNQESGRYVIACERAKLLYGNRCQTI